MEARTPLEAVYDEQISPLMEQIIAICHEHKMPCVATFELGFDEAEGSTLNCSTVIELEHAIEDKMHQLNQIIYPKRSLSMMTVRDGKGEVTSMTAFVD